VSALLVAGLAARSSAQAPKPTPDCEALRCQVEANISQCLSGAKNHGQCVSCVAHAVKQANVPSRCRGKIVRCAARSTCGKPDFETCRSQTAGTCDTSTGQCSDGTLAAGLSACAADTDCVVTTRCKIERSFRRNVTPTPGADQCTLAGGTPGTGGCCQACPTPTPVP
jgi:hypothetical protein